MLTSDLVLARRYKGVIKPRYIDDTDPEILALAEELTRLVAAHVGQPRHALQQDLRELLGTGTQFLLHRGLTKLLLDRCTFDTESPIDPEELRALTFEAAARSYLAPVEEGALFRFDRQTILQQVAAHTELEPPLEPDGVERHLYGDLKDEQILQEWKPCSAEWLLRRYNVALAQGVLFKATQLEIEIRQQSPLRYRELFRRIKFFQLLHRVTGRADHGYTIHLDGPLSLFKSSQKYGLQMASFLPTLLHFEGWTLSASLLWGKKRIPSEFHLEPGDALKPYGRLIGQWQPEEVGWLPEQFEKLGSDWTISTDGELVDLGGEGVLVPDFVFEHKSGQRVFMEVLGFWRKGAVASRLKLLRRHGPKNLILALSKQLVADPESLDDLPGEIYLFRSHPIARQVLKVLKAWE